MAWTDKPTEAQLGTIYGWIRWNMTNTMAQEAVAWLGENADRKAVSDEMQRLKKLKDSRQLNKTNCFESEVWEGFENE